MAWTMWSHWNAKMFPRLDALLAGNFSLSLRLRSPNLHLAR
jgi:hypothetical protein